MNHKSGFLTFCFAFVPGAGQMYLGYMKRGVSLMAPFCAVAFIAAFLNMGIVAILLPVIWAYAFFDTFHLRSQTPEQVKANPDAYLYDLRSFMGESWDSIVRRRHGLLGGLLIFLGAYGLYTNFVRPWLWTLVHALRLSWLGELIDGLPTAIVAALLIALGIYLLRSPGKAQPDEDYTAFRGAPPKGDDKNNG